MNDKNKGVENISKLNVSPRGPSDCFVEDLISMKNNILGSEDDINIELVLSNFNEAPDSQENVHDNIEPQQVETKSKCTGGKISTITTRAKKQKIIL